MHTVVCLYTNRELNLIQRIIGEKEYKRTVRERDHIYMTSETIALG